MVNKLIKKARSNVTFFEELMAKGETKDRKKREAMEIIKDMITNNAVIDSANQVTGKLNRKLPHKYKQHQVRSIMKDDMGMQYRRIQVVALHTNSMKNRILRQQFSIQLVNLLNQGKRIINVDESWLNMSDYRRMKWRAHGDNNSLAKTQVSPRISMIIGIETTGAVYLSLLQANNDSRTMELFFKSLVRKLDSERGSWRRNTVILIDNVSIINSHFHLI